MNPFLEAGVSFMKRHIHILHTNDIHSHLHRTPQVMTVMDSLRRAAKERGDAVVTVDVGDHMDRMSKETEGTNGQVNVAILNETGYDYVTLGNNEGLTFPYDVLNRMYDRASFQIILSNWLDLQTQERPDWMAPYVIREWFGCRVAFVGVTIPFNAFYRHLGWLVTDPLARLDKLVSRLRNEYGVNVVIVLSHLGYQYDLRLADGVPGIDIILGGHTHHLLEQIEKHRSTYLAATGKFGEYVGEVILTVDEGTGEWVGVKGVLHPVDRAEPHPRMVQLLNDYSCEAERQLSHPVIELKVDLPLDWEGESPCGNILADSLLNTVDADVALVNTGQLLEGLPAGTVTLGDLHRICPSPINPCRMELHGHHLRQALEESLLASFQQRPIRGFGFRGKQLGTLAIAGMHIAYHPEAPPYKKITDICVGREALRDDKVYRVATIDMFTFGIGYPSFKEGEHIEFFLPEFLRDLLANQLQRADHIKESFRPRWQKV